MNHGDQLRATLEQAEADARTAAELRRLAAAELAHVQTHRTSEWTPGDSHLAGTGDPDAGRHRRELLEAMADIDGYGKPRARLRLVPTNRRTA